MWNIYTVRYSSQYSTSSIHESSKLLIFLLFHRLILDIILYVYRVEQNQYSRTALHCMQLHQQQQQH